MIAVEKDQSNWRGIRRILLCKFDISNFELILLRMLVLLKLRNLSMLLILLKLRRC